ncbi:hypothetical protein [Epilithonimonas mollis]|uniref:Lipoprotein n=1 Tax=Epilithonimonas mollis TaxID=216903 RepID=A0A1M6TK87_9FLAO|nr:hypothetical protein [Epilithonimonas mollis]SHK57371.1 hypothetical protein SAMN05444371_2935 [Epilithonimonas mollis]
MSNKFFYIKIGLFLIVIFSCYNCNKVSENELIAVYEGDKVPTEYSTSDYRYLILGDNNNFHLKYLDTSKKGIVGFWKILDKEQDTIKVIFTFKNNKIIGKLNGNTFLFDKNNVFDNRFPAWLYVKTNLKSDTIVK